MLRGAQVRCGMLRGAQVRCRMLRGAQVSEGWKCPDAALLCEDWSISLLTWTSGDASEKKGANWT